MCGIIRGLSRQGGRSPASGNPLRRCSGHATRSHLQDHSWSIRDPAAVFTSSSSPPGVWVVEEQRKSPGDASVHGRSRHALLWSPHLLGFGPCLGRYLLACSETDQVVQCGAYRGDRADPPRRMTTGRLSLNPNSRFALNRLLHLCLLSADFAWSGTTHTSMTDPGCQRITHLQCLLRGDSFFPG
jgi:hypothetical protein